MCDPLHRTVDGSVLQVPKGFIVHSIKLKPLIGGATNKDQPARDVMASSSLRSVSGVCGSRLARVEDGPRLDATFQSGRG